MRKQLNEFATVTKDGVITKIGKSTIPTPKIKFKGGSVKWFDDNKLLKPSTASK